MKYGVEVQVNGELAYIHVDRVNKRIKIEETLEAVGTKAEADDLAEALGLALADLHDEDEAQEDYLENEGLYVDTVTDALFIDAGDIDLMDNPVTDAKVVPVKESIPAGVQSTGGPVSVHILLCAEGDEDDIIGVILDGDTIVANGDSNSTAFEMADRRASDVYTILNEEVKAGNVKDVYIGNETGKQFKLDSSAAEVIADGYNPQIIVR